MEFLKTITERAKSDIKTIVLPESEDIRTIRAAAMVQEQGIAKLIIVGNPDKVKELAGDLDISEARIVDPATYARTEEYAETFYELRKKKGMTSEKARETKQDCHSTANTVRPALQILKTRPGTSMVSSFFVMCVPNCEFGYEGTFVFSDCGLVENPDENGLADIAIEASKSFRQLVGAEPVFSMLSYSSYGSAHCELT